MWGLDFREIPLTSAGEIRVIGGADGRCDEVWFGIFHVAVALESEEEFFSGVFGDADDADVEGRDAVVLAGTLGGKKSVECGFGGRGFGFDENLHFAFCGSLGVQSSRPSGKAGCDDDAGLNKGGGGFHEFFRVLRFLPGELSGTD